MTTDPYRDFFASPTLTRQRHYEILRARFVEKRRVKDIAKSFGLSHYTVESRIRDFKTAMDKGEAPAFFLEPKLSGFCAERRLDKSLDG